MQAVTVNIRLGNEAMSEPGDVAGALRELADRLAAFDAFEQTGGLVRDVNGNTVGSWEVRP